MRVNRKDREKKASMALTLDLVVQASSLQQKKSRVASWKLALRRGEIRRFRNHSAAQNQPARSDFFFFFAFFSSGDFV